MRTLNGGLTIEEVLAKKYVELVKKLDVSEKQVKNNKLPSYKIFELISGLISRLRLTGMVRYLFKISNVFTSGYYSFLKSKCFRNTKKIKDIEARDIILKASNHLGYKKGSRTIKMTLENELYINRNRNKIKRIMRKYNIICPIRKANSYKRIAKATQEHSVVPNILKREFKQHIPGKILYTCLTAIIKWHIYQL